MLLLIFAKFISVPNLWLQLSHNLINEVVPQFANNSFPNNFVVIKSDMQSTDKLFLTLVQFMFIKLEPLSFTTKSNSDL